MNPFAEERVTEHSDELLATRATCGDRAALEELVKRHQAWIYNIAVRMVWAPEVAEEITQEVLLKVITRLASFQGKSRFRTWLYRIVCNHVYDMKHSSMEAPGMRFADYGVGLDSAPDLDLPDPSSVPVDLGVLVEEAKIGCTTGMLLCFDRRQRLVYILGEIFGVSSQIGAEVLDMTPDNFRQVLHRSRNELAEFMNGQCGLANASNPCRCRNKTSEFIKRGYVDPHNIRFVDAHAKSVAIMAPGRSEALESITEEVHRAICRNQPFYEPVDQVALLKRLLDSPEIRESFDKD